MINYKMTLQEILFDNECVDDSTLEMYYRGQNRLCRSEDGAYLINKGEFLDFSTYFNYVLVERNIYETVREDNWCLFGHPKFDTIFEGKKDIIIPDSWKKLYGKKIVLWAFDHNIFINTCSFDLYIKAFLDYMKNNDKIALIIRPHYRFYREILQTQVWTDSEYEYFKSYINSLKNVVWDENVNYALSYAICDAVITDINCGITVSSLPLDVPVGVTERFDVAPGEEQYPMINEGHYKIKNFDDLEAFLEMVTKGEDSKKSKRNEIRDKYITHFDGKNGQRIKDFIVEKYYEKIAAEDESEETYSS